MPVILLVVVLGFMIFGLIETKGNGIYWAVSRFDSADIRSIALQEPCLHASLIQCSSTHASIQ